MPFRFVSVLSAACAIVFGAAELVVEGSQTESENNPALSDAALKMKSVPRSLRREMMEEKHLRAIRPKTPSTITPGLYKHTMPAQYGIDLGSSPSGLPEVDMRDFANLAKQSALVKSSSQVRRHALQPKTIDVSKATSMYKHATPTNDGAKASNTHQRSVPATKTSTRALHTSEPKTVDVNKLTNMYKIQMPAASKPQAQPQAQLKKRSATQGASKPSDSSRHPESGNPLRHPAINMHQRSAPATTGSTEARRASEPKKVDVGKLTSMFKMQPNAQTQSKPQEQPQAINMHQRSAPAMTGSMQARHASEPKKVDFGSKLTSMFKMQPHAQPQSKPQAINTHQRSAPAMTGSTQARHGSEPKKVDFGGKLTSMFKMQPHAQPQSKPQAQPQAINMHQRSAPAMTGSTQARHASEPKKMDFGGKLTSMFKMQPHAQPQSKPQAQPQAQLEKHSATQGGPKPSDSHQHLDLDNGVRHQASNTHQRSVPATKGSTQPHRTSEPKKVDVGKVTSMYKMQMPAQSKPEAQPQAQAQAHVKKHSATKEGSKHSHGNHHHHHHHQVASTAHAGNSTHRLAAHKRSVHAHQDYSKVDSDHDSVPDAVDYDDDNDGITDNHDKDNANYGISDAAMKAQIKTAVDLRERRRVEAAREISKPRHSAKTNLQEYKDDFDLDGIKNSKDLDDDNDGITDDFDEDSNNDGIKDKAKPTLMDWRN